ncbi:MAG TPA: hypothetical protein VG095_03450 [Chthoniobacterales bacterium]|nr:hypothetical protein [Chthoniobacterales bacterium]
MNHHSPEDKNVRRVRQLIWLYFWLLLIEGALRKWVLPQLSNPLLIVRDPVVLLAYYFALRGGVFPRNVWIYVLGMIAVFSSAASFLVLWPYLPPTRIALVTGFGFRSNFLHLPLIFVMARVLRWEDVKRFGWWTLVLMLPMALLMVGQFRAAPDAFLNWTAGGEGEMMLSALGKVRTAGTFSFVTGVVAFCAVATAYLVWAALRRDVYKNWLLFAAGGALLIAIAVSGSRSVVGACIVVVASLIPILFLRPAAVNRFGQTLIVALVLGVIVTRLPIFKEGFNVLSTRFVEVAEATEKSIGRGMVERAFSDFKEGFLFLTRAPFLGYGLGIGTNGGAKFLVGRSTFLLSEGEWSRIFLESGPVFGLGFVLFRCALAFYVGLMSIRSVRSGNVLPLLLFSASFLAVLSGQFGQPTILGFAVFTFGLALAARHGDAEDLPAPPSEPQRRATPRFHTVRGRSAYAEQLHGSAAQPAHVNGSVDR